MKSQTETNPKPMPTVTNIAAYRFAHLRALVPLREHLISRCREWQLLGTILLSVEGINLFVSGAEPEIERLLAELRLVPGLNGLDPKYSESDERPFTRMLVKIKNEIIAFGVDGIDPAERPSPKLSPRELKQWLDEGRPVTLLDTRNNFEVKLGTFRNAVAIDIAHFRDFPKAAKELPESLKSQPIVMFCTGGIRCEKAGPYLQREGFEQVFQLDGGILKYFEECGGEHYKGDCFVFDKRVGLESNLGESQHAICFVCRAALAAEQLLDPRFVESVSCPHCYRTRDEIQAVELEEHWAVLMRVTTPLPGSVPGETFRPLQVPAHFAGRTLHEFLQGILGKTEFDWVTECALGNILDSGHQPSSADRIVEAGERWYHRRALPLEPDVNAGIRILYEDEAIIVVDKPAPLPTTPEGEFNRNTLQQILRVVYAPQKPRPAFRLTADCTGLVVFGRKAEFAQLIQSQIESGVAEQVFQTRNEADSASVHSKSLAFTHPLSGERIRFEVPIAESDEK